MHIIYICFLTNSERWETIVHTNQMIRILLTLMENTILLLLHNFIIILPHTLRIDLKYVFRSSWRHHIDIHIHKHCFITKKGKKNEDWGLSNIHCFVWMWIELPPLYQQGHSRKSDTIIMDVNEPFPVRHRSSSKLLIFQNVFNIMSKNNYSNNNIINTIVINVQYL